MYARWSDYPNQASEITKAAATAEAPSEQEVVQRILQQIRDIANTPLEQRHARLSRLAKDAVTAAAESSPQTAMQLLRLAQHACPEGDVQLTAQIRASLEQAFRITSEPASPPGESVDQSTAERISGANDRVPDAEAASKQLPTADVALSRDSGESHAISKQPQNAAAAANRHFVAAKDLIKRYAHPPSLCSSTMSTMCQSAMGDDCHLRLCAVSSQVLLSHVSVCNG